MPFAGIAFAAALSAAAQPAQATVAIVFDDIPGGIAGFNTTVTNAGAVVNTRVLVPGESGDFGDFSVARTSGGAATVGSAYSLFSANPSFTTSGGMFNINPSGSGPGLGARDSGITFTFDTAINALGFEVGDWATCCQPSGLYIQFGNSAPILVGDSSMQGDQFLANGEPLVFVSALDAAATFTTVLFWGDGFGEFLVAGGTIRYATLEEGSLPGVPAPAALGLFGFALAGLLAARRRKA
jgi:hypothetical protein